MAFLHVLEGLRTPFMDKLMQFITYFGQELIIIAVICALYWCVDKRFAYLLGFTYFMAGLLVQALKITFRVPRPWVIDPDFSAVESAIPDATGYSFPSGHTQGATCLFCPLALKADKKWQKCLCIAAFLLIGFSRMYLGCHTPKDVLVSMGLSVIITLLLWHFQSEILDNPQRIGLIACVLAVLAAVVAVYSLLLYGKCTITAEYAEDCCKAAGAGIGFALGWYLERKYLNFSVKCRRTSLQFAKFIAGLIIALLLKESVGLILGSSILAKMAEYFILVLWVIVIYPFLFSKLQRRSI